MDSSGNKDNQIVGFISRGAGMFGISFAILFLAAKVLFVQLQSQVSLTSQTINWISASIDLVFVCFRILAIIISAKLLYHKQDFEEFNLKPAPDGFSEPETSRDTLQSCWRLLCFTIIFIVADIVYLLDISVNYSLRDNFVAYLFVTQLFLIPLVLLQVYLLLVYYPQKQNLFTKHLWLLSFLLNFETTCNAFYVPQWLLINGITNFNYFTKVSVEVTLVFYAASIGISLAVTSLFWGLVNNKVHIYSSTLSGVNKVKPPANAPSQPTAPANTYISLWPFDPESQGLGLGYLQIRQGETFSILEQIEGWSFVKNNNEVQGWVPTDYVVPLNSFRGSDPK